jgi:hypothetical protein
VGQTINVQGLDALGVTMRSPDSQGFDDKVQAFLAPRSATAVLGLKPYLVFIANKSPRTIVAYSVSFNSTRVNGQPENNWVQFKFADAVAGYGPRQGVFERGREVEPGEERLVAPAFEIVPGQDNDWVGDYAQSQRNEFSDVSSIALIVDAVIFDDGTCAGPNVWQLDKYFLARLDAKQRVYRHIVDDLDSGVTVETAFKRLSDVAGAAPIRLDDEAGLENGIALRDAKRWRVKYGDGAVRPLFHNAIRARPFTITKSLN